MAKINVQGQDIGLRVIEDEDYLSLTDIARHKNPERTDDLIRNWLRNRNTLEFLGIWERLNNPLFNPVEFDGIKKTGGTQQLHTDSQAMDCRHRRRGHPLQGGPLRRHLCPQGHRV